MRIATLLVLFVTTPAAASTLYGLPALDRADFNRLAAAAGVPLFWKVDAASTGQVDPDELVAIGDASLSQWVGAGAFTAAFESAYRRLVELRRREAVARELAQGRPTLVETDLSAATREDRAVMGHLLEVARLIDALYAVQIGAAGLLERVAADDPASRALFHRNHGPWCEAPETEADPFCNALPDFPEARSFAYPDDVVVDKAFCDALAKEPNASALMDPFTVVRRRDGALVAVPYTEVYGDLMAKTAKALRAAAEAADPKDEAALRAYLLAAAAGFETNQWEPADEAWSRMSARNSRWYVRVGPDETYFEPCQLKAGFHLSLARVDEGALAWEERLVTLRTEMEQRIAAIIGPPYAARDVQFHLPEFINVVINAGDSRSGLGATVGQSLPNFGKVAEEGRGRTVAMVNLYTDADSLETARRQAASLLVPDVAALAGDPAMAQLDTVLHEATHNLGPYGGTTIDGKRPEEHFGGRVDAILEELKAQAGSLFLMKYLGEKGTLTPQQVRQGWVSTISWAFGHVARGMWTPTGQPKTYSQLAAILLGELQRAGALAFVEGGEGPDPGRFTVDFAKMPAAVDALLAEVGRIKASGDREAADALIARHTSEGGLAAIRAGLITERVLRYPKASFVYAVKR
ncbi:MAG: hypothetical protein AMXMBFR64_36730 [Myxococcales bacterium]